jgi:hypothetical protein
MWLVEEICEWLFYGVGGFLSWLGNGCRTSLKDEISENHKVRNIAVAICFFFLILIFGFLFLGK